MPSTLNDILVDESVLMRFQPIVDFSGGIYGYEATVRGPADGPLHLPGNLFRAAELSGRLVELDRLCRQVAIRDFSRLGLPGLLFLNVTAETLMQKNFSTGHTRSLLEEYGMTPQQIVIEVTEQQPFSDFLAVSKAVHHYRSSGFAVAIDDLGAGYAGLRLWSELCPNFVKIDRHFIEGIDGDPVKIHFVETLQRLAQALNCRMIAEGIETKAELAMVRKLGIAMGQGYLLGRPQQEPSVSLSAWYPSLSRTPVYVPDAVMATALPAA